MSRVSPLGSTSGRDWRGPCRSIRQREAATARTQKAQDILSAEGTLEVPRSEGMLVGPGKIQRAQEAMAASALKLWGPGDNGGTRDPYDVIGCYEALPASLQHLWSIHFVNDIFRIGSLADAKVVAEGFSQVLRKEVASVDVLKQGIAARMVNLDHDVNGFPQVYKAVAILVRALNLSDHDIAKLVAVVVSQTTTTPEAKMLRALAEVDA
ncbi:uncharacterized protein MKK02DRAFT_39710 [Dioszegia hungarica]|uniref:Uncharacterized protein n=1 Tax=Dioszegia hungarica TaxID=4972 RepID=A0AA38HFT0_9TREE|nr:uncharacterized protein MKK02DRAFT_39710 [Dioszegia hungarica]KAI9639412.1 hypothetical protein MKK02DRAFT_39710 [Dioszegia hungarica]